LRRVLAGEAIHTMRRVSGWLSPAAESPAGNRAESTVHDAGITGSATLRVSWARA